MEEERDSYKEAHKIKEGERSRKSGPESQENENNETELEANIEGGAASERTARADTKSKMKGEEKPKFHCDVCGRDSSHKGKHLEHMRHHKGVYFVCTDCDIHFESKVSRNKHQLITGHTGTSVVEGLEDAESVKNTSSQISIECHICKKTMKNIQVMKIHLKDIHGDRQYTCGNCGKMFAYKCRLREHMKDHDERNIYTCELCGKTYRVKSSLHYHNEANHINGRTFECTTCGEHFNHKRLLAKHQAVHLSYRSYICQYCTKQFKTIQDVVRHERIHTNEKLFLCHKCGKLFARKSSLLSHFTTHRSYEELPARKDNFLCHFCGKLFTLSCNLARHVKIH